MPVMCIQVKGEPGDMSPAGSKGQPGELGEVGNKGLPGEPGGFKPG